MAGNRRTNGMAVRGRRGGFASAWVVLPLWTALILAQSGCQDQSRRAQGPETASGSEKAVEVSDVGSARTPSAAEPAAAAIGAEAPAITVEETLHDFGEIGPGTTHTAQFKFTNTGTAPLVVAQVRSCCGVVTKGVKNGQKYAPGREGVLEIEYHASSVPGDMKRNLYIYSNDPAQGVVSLTIQAKIMRRVDVHPTNLKLFLKRDNGGAQDIKLTSLDGRLFSITGFRATGDSIRADFDRDVAATEFVLKPQADLGRLARNLRGQIRIDLTHPECKDVTLLYDVLAEFTVTPPQLMLFNLQPGRTVRREVWVLGNYEEDFEIESVTSQKGTLKLVESKKVQGAARDWQPSADEQRVVTRFQLAVDITPPASDNGTVLSDVLQIKIAGGQTVEVSCRGFYAGN